MDISTIISILSLVAFVGGGIVGLLLRQIFTRLESLESRMVTKVTESQVRLVIADKIEPLKEDLTEIKRTLNELVKLTLKNQGR